MFFAQNVFEIKKNSVPYDWFRVLEKSLKRAELLIDLHRGIGGILFVLFYFLYRWFLN